MPRRSRFGRSSFRRTDGGTTSGTVVPADALATWPLTVARYFLVDNDAGDDTNPGYVDAVAGSTIDPTDIPKKTIAGLMEILPRAGAGRVAVILLKSRTAGATYVDVDGVTAAGLDLSGVTGYENLLVRGSTDLTNDATDRLTCGAIVGVTGPNGDGSFTASAATTSSLTAGSGTIAAEPAAIGMRIRFKGNVTGALATTGVAVHRTVGLAITPAINFSVSPAAGDEFFIERPGVRLAYFLDGGSDPGEAIPGVTVATSIPHSVVGIATTGTAVRTFCVGGVGTSSYTFCEPLGAGTNSTVVNRLNADQILFNSSYTDEAGTLHAVGVGVRAAGALNVMATALRVTTQGFFYVGTASVGLIGQAVSVQGGTYLRTGAVLQSTLAQSVQTVPASGRIVFGLTADAATVRDMRVAGAASGQAGALLIRAAYPCDLGTIEFENCAVPMVKVGQAESVGFIRDAGLIPLTIHNCTNGPDGGNTDVAVDLTDSYGALVRIVASTFAGTAGEVRLNGPALTTYAALAITNVIDNAGNNVLGAAGQVVTDCTLVSNQSGGALDVGDVVRGNGTTAQVTSAQADTEANAAPLGVMVTPPASAALGYMATAGSPVVRMTGAPTPGAVAYLSIATARQATTTVPAPVGTEQTVKLGRVITAVSASLGRVAWHPDQVPESTDVAAPVPLEVEDADHTFTTANVDVTYIGDYTAERTATLPPLASVPAGTTFSLKEFITVSEPSGDFLYLAPDGTDELEGDAAPYPIPVKSRACIKVQKSTTIGWVIR